MAQPFDAARLQTTADSLPVAEQVDFLSATSLGRFSVSQTGVLAYFSGGAIGGEHLTWFDRAGKYLGTLGIPGDMRQPAISPDGSRVAIDQRSAQDAAHTIWLDDLAHNTSSKFTFDTKDDGHPAWSPDGSQLVFISNRTGKYGLYRKAASGTGKEELLFESPERLLDTNWSRDGKFVVFTTMTENAQGDIWVLPNPLGDAASRKPFPFVQTSAYEFAGRISPDGKYLAYGSNESGPMQVYVQSFPAKDAKFQISTDGGTRPVWSHDGKELFYISNSGKIMAVDVKGGVTFEHRLPQPLFEVRTANNARFDVTPDGKRFLVVSTSIADAEPSLMVVLNWHAGVKK
jgi:dipeptidyl aminopeptidase/acylaminoacyl peptidase